MAAEEPSKSEFESILSCINRKFDIISTKWTDDRNFEAKFRTQVPRDNDDYNALCDEWVDLFSTVTSTTWVKKISNTGPQIRFRKQYQCWTHPGEVRKELLFDPRKCKATLDIKVLTDNEHTRKKNKFIKQGLNVVVKLNFTHLHSCIPTKPFAFFAHSCDLQCETKSPVKNTLESGSYQTNIQSLDAMKLHVQSQSQHFTPFVVSAPQYEDVMCQSNLIFDQAHSVISGGLPPQFFPMQGFNIPTHNEQSKRSF